MTNNEVRIVSEDDLDEKTTLRKFFNGYEAVAFFYSSPSGIGHWVLVSLKTDEDDKKFIEYFDPLALPVDEINAVWGNPDKKGLKDFLNNIGLPVKKASRALERKDHETCGRHVAVRFHFRAFPLDEYIAFMKSHPKLSSDEFTTFLSLGLPHSE